MSTSARPVAPAPIAANIPAELQARPQWVVWRYKRKGKKWTKVPYTADASVPAVACDYTNPSSWRSFDQALAFYRSRSGHLAGIGYVFSADDPYVGGDQDHDLSLERIPATYAEISPSGAGVKFIARANGAYGRKTARGELYSSKRFFTITGRVLPGHEQITECQAQIEAFAASLGGNLTKGTKDGTRGASASGNRAELVKAIPESEWEAGRRLVISGAVDQVVNRVKAAAGEGTQFALLLRGDYAEFNRRWPFVGIYRKDGTLDASQVRAVAARGIKGRGFTFAEYAAAMHRLYAAEALAKWGSKDLWRQELAALWDKSPAPRFAWQPRPAPRRDVIKRGRGRPTHAPEVERFYTYLRERISGAEPVTIAALAADYGIHRRTISTYLTELRDAKRIAWQRAGRYGGLIITFDPTQDVIENQPTVEAVSPQPSAPNLDVPAAALEETEITTCVSSESREADHSLYDAIRVALDVLPGKRLNERTGELRAWPRSTARICAWLAEQYPRQWPLWERSAAYAIMRVRRQQRNARFAELRDLSSQALSKELGSVSATIGRFDRRATEAATPEIAAWYQTEANRRRGRLAMLVAERAERDEREARRLAQFGYSQAEQAEMLAEAEAARDALAWRPGRAVKIAPVVDQPPAEGTPASLLTSLFARKEARHHDRG